MTDEALAIIEADAKNCSPDWDDPINYDAKGCDPADVLALIFEVRRLRAVLEKIATERLPGCDSEYLAQKALGLPET